MVKHYRAELLDYRCALCGETWPCGGYARDLETQLAALVQAVQNVHCIDHQAINPETMEADDDALALAT